MAVSIIRAEFAQSNGAPAAPAHLIPASLLLAHFGRDALEGLIASAIDLLDLVDGDVDLEDDDPAGIADEDGHNFLVSPTIREANTLDPAMSPTYRLDQGMGPLPFDGDTDRRMMSRHRDRIRAMKCVQIDYPASQWSPEFTAYRLREGM